MADVRLVDLEVIKQFSLAVRCDTAPAAELLAALDASRQTVLAAMDAPPVKPRTPAPRKAGAIPKKAATKPTIKPTIKPIKPTLKSTKAVPKAAPGRRRASE